jgi:2-C-methyl-D-erythritol 4-phosphate cytidylyltransferase
LGGAKLALKKTPPFLIQKYFYNSSMNKTSAKIGDIIVGAGHSERMGTDKMFLPLADKPILAWSTDVCQNYKPITKIVLVLNEKNLKLGHKLISERGWTKVIAICLGGERRQDSVKEGLNKLGECNWVIIHDGARPFLTSDLLNSGLEAATITGAASAAVPVKDTIKLSNNDGIVVKTLPRDKLWMIQTPQIFRFDIITRAYEKNSNDVTDDASLIENSNGKVKLYMGSYKNTKITTPDDIVLAEAIARG